MGYLSWAYDRLPNWVQITVGVCAVVGFVYGVAHEGWIFLVKVIFSPEP